MKNYIKIDAEGNRLSVSLAFEDDGSNDICVTVANGEKYGRILVFYGSTPKETHFIHQQEKEYFLKINQNNFSGKGLVHIQYNDSRMTEVVHILGKDHLKDLWLVKKTERILSCEGVPEETKTEETDLKTEVVKTLPDAKKAKAGVIYLIPKASDDRMDKYDEYQCINGSWERFSPAEEDKDIDFEKII